MCLATKVMEHASHFNSNVARSDNSHLVRPLFQVEETIGAYAQLASWSLGYIWVATRGKQYLFSANDFFAAIVEDNLDFIFRKQASAAVKPFNVIIAKVLIVYAI